MNQVVKWQNEIMTKEKILFENLTPNVLQVQ